ncbi:MAG TPA: RIO1 family regulatory kinase/ATPase [Anaerolineales bacterium]|nr:RIO1 family regulatory kinase/ATPase [Anaerolineales bacterium]
MDKDSYHDVLEDLEDVQGIGPYTRFRKIPKTLPPRQRPPKQQIKPPAEEWVTELVAEQDISAIKFTYQASRTEEGWLNDSLGFFYESHWIDDVLRLVKGGKEASVYLCSANPATGLDYLAAKVYRPRRLRSLRNDHLYQEGRDRLDEDGNPIIDDGKHHAMDKRTSYGLELTHISWIEHEVRALRLLSEAGACVPTPYTRGHNAILMDFIGDPEMAAPTLNSVHLEVDEAKDLFRRLLADVECALTLGLIHGDLSAYNILYWEGEATLIDFPQVVSPQQNRNAYQIFKRDIRRLCDYFVRQGVEADPNRIAVEMWTRRGLRRTPEVHPGLLDDQNEEDLAYWRKLQDR